MRRGLAELLAALIVAVTLVTVAGAIMLSLHRTANIVGGVSGLAAERISAAGQPPVLSVEERGDSLYLVIYTSRPFNLSYIVYHKGNKTVVERVGLLVEGREEVLVDEHYDCEPASIALVTSEGLVVSYSPARDPRVLAAAHGGRWSLLEKTVIDCDLLDSISESGPQGPGEGLIVLGSGDEAEVIVGDPGSIDVSESGPTSQLPLLAEITGSMSGSHVSVDVSVRLPGSEELGSARLEAVYPRSPHARVYVASVPWSPGFEVEVYAIAACAPGACVAGLELAFERPATYYGEAQVSLEAEGSYAGDSCVLGSQSYAAPAVMGAASLYNASVDGSCKTSYYTASYTLSGRASGYFSTSGPIALIYSTLPYSYGNNRVNLVATLLLKGVAILNGSPARARVPCGGPIKYWLTGFTITGSDPLTRALMSFFNSTRRPPALEVSVGEKTLERTVETEAHVIPLPTASYTLVVPPEYQLPLTTALNLSFAENDDAIGGASYHWDIRGLHAPQPYLQHLPHLVNVECISTGKRLVIVLPTVDPLRISQAGREYAGLAPLIGGLEASVEGPTGSQVLYLISLTGSLEEGLLAEMSIYYSPQRLPGSAEMIPPSRPGFYIIVAVPNMPSEDPQAYTVTYMRSY